LNLYRDSANLKLDSIKYLDSTEKKEDFEIKLTPLKIPSLILKEEVDKNVIKEKYIIIHLLKRKIINKYILIQ